MLVVHIALEFDDEKTKAEKVKAIYKIAGKWIISKREAESEAEITEKDKIEIALAIDELDKGDEAEIFLNGILSETEKAEEID